MLLFGPPGAGKSHLASAIGLALIENGYRVMFTRSCGCPMHQLHRALAGYRVGRSGNPP